MLKYSEMIKANIERLENEMNYIDEAMANREFRSGFPQAYDKMHICPQELNIELQPGIVAQLPLVSAYFDLDGYIALYLKGARLYHGVLCKAFREAMREEAAHDDLSGSVSQLPSFD